MLFIPIGMLLKSVAVDSRLVDSLGLLDVDELITCRNNTLDK